MVPSSLPFRHLDLKEKQDMVAKVDMDGSGLLNFPEFLAMMGYKVSQAAHAYYVLKI